MVREEAVGRIVLTPVPRFTLPSLAAVCVGTIPSGRAIWLMGSGNVELDGRLKGKKGTRKAFILWASSLPLAPGNA